MADSILCAIDFSDASLRALQWAIDQAKLNQYHLHILYTYRLQAVAQESAFQVKQKMVDTANKKFAEVEKERLNKKNINYDFRTEVGFLEDRLVDRIAKNSVKSVVLPKALCKGNDSLNEVLENVGVPVVMVD